MKAAQLMEMCDTAGRPDWEEEAAGLTLRSRHVGKSEIPSSRSKKWDGKVATFLQLEVSIMHSLDFDTFGAT